MFKDIKIKLILFLIALTSILFLIMNQQYKEAKRLNKEMALALDKEYQSSEYVQTSFRMIQESNYYQNDSLWVSAEKQLHSNNESVENSLQSIYNTPEKWDSIYLQIVNEKVPEYFVLYKEATKPISKP